MKRRPTRAKRTETLFPYTTLCRSSAMRAALIAAITLFIWVAWAASAALASAAWVTTPVDSEATSGTRLASAWAETDSSVPSLAGMVGGWVRALAGLVMKPRAGSRARAGGQQEWRDVGGSVMGYGRCGPYQLKVRRPGRS